MATQGPTTGAPASATFLTNEAATIATIMARFSKRQLQTIGEAAIDMLDARSGDTDFEIDDPAENDGTEFDQAWIEWTGMSGAAKRGPNFHAGEEDAEDAEGGGDDSQSEDEPGFDKASRAAVNSYGDGAGCSINGDREPNGDEDDYSR